ncbi:MAG TPA: Clp protease N-terminal domain-containing protein [Solirubrobacteraceae bacterium]|nr:Clp protease N-terminal domain-containing protein [Solirubrobacteraceae bacterium]
MFERFTERARRVVVLAQEEARELKHDYIGTEHILLGLIREEEGVAAHALASLGISLESALAQVARIVAPGQETTAGHMPFTPRAKKVLYLSLREALDLNHNYIGTEHILLGLVRENEGIAMRVLLDFDADSEKIRNAVIRAMSSPESRSDSARAKGRGIGSDPGMRQIDPTWVDWIAGALDELATEIRQQHGRNPDSGDLLIVLATASDTVASEMVRELGFDSDRLADIVPAARRARAASDPYAQIEKIRQNTQEALESENLGVAARFRDEERSFTLKLTSERAAALEEIRVRLGLAERKAGD